LSCNEGLQIGINDHPSYRAGTTIYTVQDDIIVGQSKALANTQYGSRGFEQLFV